MLDGRPLEDDLAVGRLEQTHERPAEGRLAATRLTDESERLPQANGKAHIVDGVHTRDLALEDALADREVLLDVPDLEEWGFARSLRLL
jgi:hypothetical protein